MPLYHTSAYWNNRYFHELDYFDWYFQYDDIVDSIQIILNELSQMFPMKESPLQILDFGCGTSLFTHKLFSNHNNLNILAIDSSKNCITFMDYNHNKNINDNPDTNSTLKYEQTVFETIGFNKKSVNHEKYHLIIDKGTTDSILCGVNGMDKAKRIMNHNIYNLLKRDAVYLLISHHPNRYKLFVRSKWAVSRTQITIPYFNDNKIAHYQITNDIKKYLNENNRILVQYVPNVHIDDSEQYLAQLKAEEMKQQNEQEKAKEKAKEIEKAKEKLKKPVVFDLEQKTEEQLMEDRRKRRLEYEAVVNAAKAESERFRNDFIKKQRLKEEQLRKQKEEERKKKIVINVDQILKEKEQETKGNEEEEDESDGGYMTDSSEDDNRKERQRQEMIMKLIEQHDNDKKIKKMEKKKKKNKGKCGKPPPKPLARFYDENLSIYEKFRSKYCTLIDVESIHEPYCCLNENGMDERNLNKYKQLLINQIYRDAQQTNSVSKTFYMYIATKKT